MTTITDEHRKAAREFVREYGLNPVAADIMEKELAHLLASREEKLRAEQMEKDARIAEQHLPDTEDPAFFATVQRDLISKISAAIRVQE